MSSATFKTPAGTDPGDYIIKLKLEAQPNTSDALFAVERQKTRILERTAAGVDVDGRPFEPYDTSRPYYYYPNGRVGSTKFSAAQNKSAAHRLNRKLGGIGRVTGAGIKFESYAAFKAALGRANVDLRGPRAPHMLQALIVGVNGQKGPAGGVDPAREASLGIYGAEAGRAEAHNTGENPRWARKHQRRFLGASASDIQAIVQDITNRVLARLKK